MMFYLITLIYGCHSIRLKSMDTVLDTVLDVDNIMLETQERRENNTLVDSRRSCGDAFRALQAGGVCGLCGKCCHGKGVSREKVGGWMWHNGGFRCKAYTWDVLYKGQPKKPNIDAWCQWSAPVEPHENAPKDKTGGCQDKKIGETCVPEPGRGQWGCQDTGNDFGSNRGPPKSTSEDTGRQWTLVFRQTVPFKASTSAWISMGSPSDDNFSILDQLESFRGSDGKFTFKLLWPQKGGFNYNIWKQTSNPVTMPGSHSGVEGYEGVETNFNDDMWGGLEKGGSDSLLDGHVNDVQWFYAVGASNFWNDKIPGPPRDAEKQVELYVSTALVQPTPAPIAAPTSGCPDNSYTRQQQDGQCYKLHSEKESWSDAESVCQSEGAHLADSTLENLNLVRTLAQSESKIWLGGSKDSATGNYLWMDGTKVEDGLWNSGEPNNWGGQESCLALKDGGTNDDNCASKYAFLCKIEEGSPTPPTTAPPTTAPPTTAAPTTAPPTTAPPTTVPTEEGSPTVATEEGSPTTLPTEGPPTTMSPTVATEEGSPTVATEEGSPTVATEEGSPTVATEEGSPTTLPTEGPPTTMSPTTVPPTTMSPTTVPPTVSPPTVPPTVPPTASTSGYTYIGCFVDDAARDLEYRIGRLQAYNQESCHNACAQRYFALQWHGSCWCGDAYGTEVQYEQVDDEQCGSDRLGRGWRNAIYSHPAQQEQEEEEEEEEEEASTVAPSTGYTYIGCYVDDAARDLETRIGRRQAYNQESCHNACDQRYFALQWHGSCWCGDAYGTEVQYKKVADEQCGSDRLGRGWRNAVYSHKDTPSLSDTLSKISDTISNTPGTISDTISNTPGTISGTISNIPGTISGTISNIPGTISNNIPTTIPGTISNIPSTPNIPGTISDTISNNTPDISNVISTPSLTSSPTPSPTPSPTLSPTSSLANTVSNTVDKIKGKSPWSRW